MNDTQGPTTNVAALCWTGIASQAVNQALRSVGGVELIAVTHQADRFTAVLPDAAVLLLDHRLPRALAARCMRSLDEQRIPHRSIIINVPDEPSVIVRYLEAGAMGYMRLDEPVSHLAGMIRDVGRGCARLEPEIAALLLARMEELRRRVAAPASVVQMTDNYVADPNGTPQFDGTGSRTDRFELAIAASRDLESAARTALDFLCTTFGFAFGSVYFRSPSHADLVSVATWHRADRYAEFVTLTGGFRVSPGAGVVGQVYQSGRCYWARRIERVPQFQRAASARTCGLRSMTVMPIIDGDSTVGALELFTDYESEPSLRSLEALLIATNRLGPRVRRFAERQRRQA